MVDLSPAAQKLVVHWGEMGSRWGVNRTVAQIHALLYLARRPLDAAEIAETLSVARSNVSTGLRELEAWGIVRVSHVLGDRRDYYESVTDIWQLFKTIVEQRWRREMEPTLAVLEQCLSEAEDGDEHTRRRVRDLQKFFQTMESWFREFQTMDAPDVQRVATMGGKLRRLLRLHG